MTNVLSASTCWEQAPVTGSPLIHTEYCCQCQLFAHDGPQGHPQTRNKLLWLIRLYFCQTEERVGDFPKMLNFSHVLPYCTATLVTG